MNRRKFIEPVLEALIKINEKSIELANAGGGGVLFDRLGISYDVVCYLADKGILMYQTHNGNGKKMETPSVVLTKDGSSVYHMILDHAKELIETRDEK